MNYIVVTDEGCYSDYGFHICVTTEEKAKEIVSLYKELWELDRKDISKHHILDWSYDVKQIRYSREVGDTILFDDISEGEWDWLNADELIAEYNKHLKTVKEAKSGTNS